MLFACAKPTYLVVQVSMPTPDTTQLGARVAQIQFQVSDALADAGPIFLPAAPDAGVWASGGTLTLEALPGKTITVLLNGYGLGDGGPIASGWGTTKTPLQAGNNPLSITLGPHCNQESDCAADEFCAGLVTCSGPPGLPAFNQCTASTIDAGLQPWTARCGQCGQGHCSATGAGICLLATCNCVAPLPPATDGGGPGPYFNLDAGTDGGVGFVVDPSRGQYCNGNISNTTKDACRSNCEPAHCGDGIVDTGEVCDLDGGHNGTGEGCNQTCTLKGQVLTLAGDANAGLKDGFGTSARFAQPYGVTIVDGGNVLYIADISFKALRALNLESGFVQTLAGGNGGFFDGDGPATEPDAGFNEPLAVLPFDGGLIVTDYGALRFYSFSPTFDGGTLSTFAGTRATNGIPAAGFDAGPFFALDAGPVLGWMPACLYGEPHGIAQLGNFLYSNADIDGWIVASNLTTQEMYSVATLGPIVQQGGLCTFNGLVYSSESANPGDLYVYDPSNPVAGANPVGVTPALQAPDGICSDYKTSIYICETSSNLIRQYNVDSGILSTVAGGGQVVPEQDGLGSAAGFFNPAACVVDPVTGYLYVVDKSGNTIREIQ